MTTCDRCGKPADSCVEVFVRSRGGIAKMPFPTTDLCPDCKSAYISQLADTRLCFKKTEATEDDPIKQAILDLIFLQEVSSKMFDHSQHSNACRGAQKRLLSFAGHQTHFKTIGNFSGYCMNAPANPQSTNP